MISFSASENISIAQKYFWRVLAYNVCGAPVSSAIWQFTLVNITTMPGLAIWLRADSSIMTDGSGNVTNWINNTGSGLNFTGTSGSEPKLVTNVLNGRPVVRFNSTNNTFLSAGDNFNQDTNSRTVFIVANANNSQYAFFAKALAHVVPGRYSLLNDGSGLYVLYDDQNLVQAYAKPTPAGTNIISHVIDRNQQLIRLYVDGVHDTTVGGILPSSF